MKFIAPKGQVSALSNAELSFPIVFIEPPVNLQLEKLRQTLSNVMEHSLRRWLQRKTTFRI
jgi:hypothetical protein